MGSLDLSYRVLFVSSFFYYVCCSSRWSWLCCSGCAWCPCPCRSVGIYFNRLGSSVVSCILYVLYFIYRLSSSFSIYSFFTVKSVVCVLYMNFWLEERDRKKRSSIWLHETKTRSEFCLVFMELVDCVKYCIYVGCMCGKGIFLRSYARECGSNKLFACQQVYLYVLVHASPWHVVRLLLLLLLICTIYSVQ